MNIFQNIAESKSNSLIYSEGSEYSYGQLYRDSKEFHVLQTINRHLVFIIAKNTYDCLIGYIGLLNANCVVAMITDSVSESMLNDLLERFKPSFIYMPQRTKNKKNNWVKKLRKGEYILYETNVRIDYSLNENLSMILMTSGSTGDPEFVRLSHSNIFSNTKKICEYLGISDTDTAITTLPMSYSYGISIINTHLYMGASLILTESSIVEKNFWDLMKDFKVTNFGGVPYTYDVLKKLKFEKIDTSSIRYLTQAGGKLSLDLLNYFEKACTQKKIKFFVMYGQTEAAPRMSYVPPKMLKKKIGSIGIAIPGGKFHLIDGKGKMINEVNVEGELVYEGKNVCLGYAKNNYDLSLGDLNKGILKTGDMAIFDFDGYFFITGRKKRFLKLFGNRVNLDQIEKKLRDAGFECVCTGNDEHLKIFTNIESNVKNIIMYITKTFNLNKSVFSVTSISEIPRNDSGKILYSKLNEKRFV